MKVLAARGGFQRMFPEDQFEVVLVDVPSEVSAQPATDAETRRGALNRARQAQEAASGDYWIGTEGGVEDTPQGMLAFAWVAALSAGVSGAARSGAFYLPPGVAELVRAGKELGEADDIVFGRENSKQDNGAIGLLTGNVVDRAQLYEQAVVLALVAFKNRTLY